MEVNAVVVLGLTDLNSSLERGLLDAPKEIAYSSPEVNTSIAISLEVLHLLIDLLVLGNVHLKVVFPELPFVLEGSELIFKLSCMVLSEAGPKECKPQLLVSGMDIAGLVKLINANICSCILNEYLKLSITMAESRINSGD